MSQQAHNSDHPSVSVVVAARNEGDCIDACLDALAGQDYPSDRVEIVVVDNASTDDTAARAATHPVSLIHESVPGPAAARNAGIRASKGEIVAFTDADAVPRPDWLRKLVGGAADPEVGCFVGEIVPIQPLSLVACHAHDRDLISQRALLSATPPVAATGCIAYRKAVFDTIGMFDQSFLSGEDGDLFWRMTMSSEFHVRYNPEAVVAHAHPATVGAAVRRALTEGTGLARFRTKHRNNLPYWLSSFSFTFVGLLKILAGCLLYPLHVQRYLVMGCPAGKALAYPLLDKLYVIPRTVAILLGFTRVAFARKNGTRRLDLTAAAPMNGSGDTAFRDCLVLDLSTAPLLCTQDPAVLDRVRRELTEVTRNLARDFAGSSVVLSGSLSAGEGQVQDSPAGPLLASDYDIFVVTPRLLDAIPWLARRKVARLLSVPLSASLDIGFVWRPLLRMRKTTLGGAVVAGEQDLCRLLPHLHAPRAISTLLRAYHFLASAPIEPERYAQLSSQALVRAARAIMWDDRQSQPREKWNALSSLKSTASEFESWKPVLGNDIVAAVQKAAAFLLGMNSEGPRFEDHGLHCRVLRAAASCTHSSDGRMLAAKHFLWLLGERRFGIPRLKAGRHMIESLRRLAESWVGGQPDCRRIAAAEYTAARLFACADGRGLKDPVARYTYLQQQLARLATFNPHRVIYPQQGGET